MSKDLEEGVNKVVHSLAKAFDAYNAKNIELDKSTVKFWNKLKKRLPEEVVNNFEADPTAGQPALRQELTTIGDNAGVKMNLVMYLHEQGISLD